ncbi:MAG: hypothetical protein M3259_10315, partial [Actinomycetota bacterium]|nr:hypothetical protein [Actinomycetota bacterium]
MVARRCTWYPGATIKVVPLVVIRGLGPPVTLVVLYHQLLALGVEFVDAYCPSLELALKPSVAALSFLKVHLFTLEFRSYVPPVTDLNSGALPKVSRCCSGLVSKLVSNNSPNKEIRVLRIEREGSS